MKIEIKLIHNEWEDTVLLDFSTNKLNRINIKDEYGDFILDKNKLYVIIYKINKKFLEL